MAHQSQLLQLQRDSDELQAMIDRATRDAGLIDAVLAAIDSFLTAVAVIPSGARRSALATAALHEQLRGATPAITHVLLIKAQSGRSQQLLDNRPLWLNDKFSTMVEVSVTYVLIETKTSNVLASGTASRIARAHGTLGEAPELGYIGG